MHYYKRDIGKYYKKAGRLTMLQHGAYTMLMDACYDRETFPTIEQAIDWCWATSSDEIEAVKFVLSKFFTEYDGVFKQSHITETLDNYHKNKATNKTIAIKREADRRTKREQSVNEPPPNKELLITNNKLKTKDQNKRASPFVPPKIEEVILYCLKRRNEVDPQAFIDHYEANGWVRGKTKIKSWQACVRTWEKNNGSNGQGQNTGFDQRSRAKKVSDKLDEIARKDIERNGFTSELG